MIGDVKKAVSYKLNLSKYERKKRNGTIMEGLRKSIDDYLENSENSKMKDRFCH